MALLLLACLAVGWWAQAGTLLNHDLGWIVRSAGMMLDGARFGSDIIEPNLPVAWYLAMPAVWFHRHAGIDEVTAIRVWSFLIVGLSLATCALTLLRSRMRFDDSVMMFAALAITGCVLVGYSFGQREHMAFMLTAPFVLVTVCRLAGDSPAPTAAAGVGLLAAIGVCIKPHFVAVPVMLELAVLATLGRRWHPLRVETVTLALSGLGMAVAVVVTSPDYLLRIVPELRAVYWAFDAKPGRMMLLLERPVQFAALALLMVALLRQWTAGLTAWFAASLGWLISCVSQGKAFEYHGFPMAAGSLVLLALAAAAAQRSVRTAWRDKSGLQLVLASLALIVPVGGSALAVQDFENWRTDNAYVGGAAVAEKVWLIEWLKAKGIGPGSTMLALSTHPFPGFPTASYLGAEWVAVEPCMFAAPAWVRQREIASESTRVAAKEAFLNQRARYRRALSQRPDVIIVTTQPSFGIGRRKVDLLALTLDEDERRRLAESYVEYKESGLFRVFLRRKPERPSE